MTKRALKEGSKGRCLHCGFPIEVRNIRTGKMFVGPFWMLAWVHPNSIGGYRRSCHWSATPAPHTKKEEVTTSDS